MEIKKGRELRARLRVMAAGRPKESLEDKLHKGIRKRVEYTGKKTLVKLGSGVPEAARKNRPKGADGKMMSAEAWDAWWRKMLDEGEYTQCASATYGTQAKRDRAEMASATQQGANEGYVREWVMQRGREGRNSEPHMSPGMLETMWRTRAGGATTRKAVQAATLAVAYKEGWHIQHSGLARGAAEISAEEWVEKVGSEAVEEGTYTATEMERVVRGVKVSTMPKGPKALVLGSGYGGATTGLMLAGMPVIGVDCEAKIQTGTREGVLAPDVMAMFSDARGNLVKYSARRGCVKVKDIVMVQASPSCQATSIANSLGRSRGCGRGKHGGQEAEEKERNEFMKVVTSLLEWEEEARKQGRMVAWVIEQPRDGSMKDDAQVTTSIGAGVVVNGCAYGTLHQKPYRFWTNVQGWEPRDSKVWCKSCKKREEHEQQVVPRKGSSKKRPRLEGYTNEAARNRIPPGLMAHWAEAAKAMMGL